MEKQFNSDSEPVNVNETLTYRVGQLPLPATPRLNLVYKEDGASAWFIDFGDGTLNFHAKIEGPITKSRMRHFEDVWLQIVMGLYERGMNTIETWIDYENEEQKHFAEFFGFEETGFLKRIDLSDGSGYLMEELTYKIPLKD